MTKQGVLRSCALPLLCLAAAAALPAFAPVYYVQFASKALLMGLLAMALNLVVGHGGLVSLCHAAFFGLAGYVLALAAPRYEAVSLWWTLPLAVAASAALALVIGALALRTRGVAFIMVTLAFGEMLFFLFHDGAFAGGSDGAFIDARPSVRLGDFVLLDLDNATTFYLVVLAVVAAALSFLAMLLRAPFGRALMAARDNERRARALGFAVFRLRLIAFTISGALAGVAGYFAAAQFGFVAPQMLGWHLSATVLVMVLIGGTGSVAGPLVGALALLGLEEVLKGALESWKLVEGIIVIALVLLLPGGVRQLWPMLIAARENDGGSAASPSVIARSEATKQPPPPNPPPLTGEGKGGGSGLLRGACHRAALCADPLARNDGRMSAPRNDDGMSGAAPRPGHAGDVVLRAENLHRRFGGLAAVSDVTLALRAGEIHALIGPNGAGKSTLVNLLSGELAPDAGRIGLGDADVTQLPPARRALLGLGRAYQTTTIFPRFTARENVRLAAQAHAASPLRMAGGAEADAAVMRATEEALRRVGLLDRADEVAMALSHGAQRQLEIAMVLAGRPRVLLLDEPLAGMGTAEAQAMVALIAALKADCAVLVIEHDMAAVFALADRLTVMAGGRVIASGAPSEVRADPAVQRAYLGDDAEDASYPAISSPGAA
jgi:branched-chain amino acid transport system permease protein